MTHHNSKDTTTLFPTRKLSWSEQVNLATTNWTTTEKEDYDSALKECNGNKAAPLVTLAICKILDRVFTERGDTTNAARVNIYISKFQDLFTPSRSSTESMSYRH